MKTFLSLLVSLAVLSPTIGAELSTQKSIQKGDALDAQFKTQEALEVFLEADAKHPGNAEILRRIAREYGLSMNDVTRKADKIEFGRKALAAAKRAVEADPNNANAQLALAVSYGRLALLLDNKTQLQYANLIKKHAERSIDLDPNNDLAWHVMGAWSYGVANLNGVMRTLAKWAYGDVPQATNEQAVDYFQKAISLNPRRVGNHVELGRTYLAMGEKTKAKAEFEKGLALPNSEKDDVESKRRAREELRKL